MRNNQPVYDSEYILRDDQYLISRTDLDGRIVYANPTFIEVSGFDREELIGEHHNIVRHPDMPPAAFADLWATVRDGNTWSGYVKNRRKDGTYYWVFATVSAIVEDGVTVGYGSVRVKAAPEKTAEMTRLYQRINAGEVRGYRIQGGSLRPLGVRAIFERLAFWRAETLRARVGWLAGSAIVGFFCMAALGIYATLTPGDSPWLIPAMIVLAVGGSLWLGGLSWLLVRSFLRPLQQALTFSRQIGTGNLKPLKLQYNGNEVGQLLFALEIMRKSLLSIAHDIHGSVDGVVNGADKIARGNSELAGRTQQQAAALEQTAASMEEFASSVEQNAANARQANQVASEAAQTAIGGSEVVHQAVERMRLISASSRKITDIIGVIDGIAFQTNILALNAAVEAARAGAQGKGFAVVAGEVRSLAQKSAQAAKEIKLLIEESVLQIDAGAELVTRAGDTMREVVASIERATTLMSEIAAASGEQATGISEVKSAVNQMDEVTQHNALQVEEAAAAAQHLRHKSAFLSHSASVFIIDHQGDSAPATT